MSGSGGFNLDAFIERLMYPERNRLVSISESDAKEICRIAKESFQRQITLLEIKGPVNVCGDIHGQYFDLLRLFHVGGCPSVTTYLFLGDYVDRGPNSLETICLLLALKSRYPTTFFLIRGNHEQAPINRVYGFFKEIKRRFRKRNFMEIYLQFNDTFNYLPIAAVVDGNAFCCHGGISPSITTLENVSDIQRPIYPSKTGIPSDIMWSDPDDTITEWNHSHRGIGYLWGIAAHERFLLKNNLKIMIRAHQCVNTGYRWMFSNQLVTVFSAPNYSRGNTAAIATYNTDGTLTFTTFK